MYQYSTVQAAKQLGLSTMTLHRYIRGKKIPVPKLQELAGVRVRVWTDRDIERVRNLLPKIANGRKTRWQKQRNQKPQPRVATATSTVHGTPGSSTVPHKKRGNKK